MKEPHPSVDDAVKLESGMDRGLPAGMDRGLPALLAMPRGRDESQPTDRVETEGAGVYKNYRLCGFSR